MVPVCVTLVIELQNRYENKSGTKEYQTRTVTDGMYSHLIVKRAASC